MGKKYDIIVKAVNEVFETYSAKMTLRQVYYRLVSKHIIPNNINAYKGLSRHLVKARENRDVDWRRFEDRARTTHGGDWGYDNVDDTTAYVDGKLNDFKTCWEDIKLTRWKGQDVYVEIWIEKDALSRLAQDAVRDLGVRVCPSKGYSSFTYIAETVSRLSRISKPIKILYFGDFDPSGIDIERDLYDRLVRYGVDASQLDVTRYALTIEQIEEYELPPMPAKRSDVRYASFVAQTGGSDAVELDALEPPILSRLIRDAVEGHIDQDIWDARQEQERDIQNRVREILEQVEIEWDG